MLFHLNLARAIAILLVTNSHLGEFYPWPMLASGGMVGNCLFFICSGWSIAYSLRNTPVGFAGWIRKRLLRLYFPLVLWMCVLLAFSRYEPASWEQAVGLLLWPSDYWFIPAIALFYVPVYLLSTRVRGQAAWGVVLALLAGVYLLDYLLNRDLSRWSIEESIASKLHFYLVAVGIGVAFGCVGLRRRVPWYVAALAVLGYLALHYVLKSHGLFQWQVLVQVSGLIAATLFVAALAQCPVQAFERGTRSVVDHLSSRAIYIYLAQVPLVTGGLSAFAPFPLNVAAMLLMVAVLAELLYQLDLPRLRQLVKWRAVGAP